MKHSLAEKKRRSWLAMDRKLAYSSRWIQIFSNVTGILICFSYFIFYDKIRPQFSNAEVGVLIKTGTISLGLIVFGYMLSSIWMKKIRQFIRLKIEQRTIPAKLEATAKKRIFNLPFTSAFIGVLNWSIASITIPLCYTTLDFSLTTPFFEIKGFLWVTIGIFLSGLVTSVITFFLMELICRPIWEEFSPKGDFLKAKGIFRINLWHRILIIFFMASLFPLADMAMVSYEKAQMMVTTNQPENVLKSLLQLIFFLLAVEFSLVLILSMFMSSSIVKPILELKTAMQKIGQGDFSARAKVMDNNELGILALNFNKMARGLKEHYELTQSLAIAKQVQQNLLPTTMPKIEKLDIAAKSLYCDQTGGDYFDFIEPPETSSYKKIIALGDVSGHGIPSALLMASARAFLRQRAALGGTLDLILQDVNLQFCNDVGGTGRFMSMVLLGYDGKHAFDWIRAGHDPALHFKPDEDRFYELKRKGIPLGVDDTYLFQMHTLTTFKKNQILFVGTDGIWESRNAAGQMFGKEKIKQLIRDNHHKSAEQIMDSLLANLEKFLQGTLPDDDITLLIIKSV